MKVLRTGLIQFPQQLPMQCVKFHLAETLFIELIDDFLFQLLHHLHHVPCLLPGTRQRRQVRGCHVVSRVIQRSLKGTPCTAI